MTALLVPSSASDACIEASSAARPWQAACSAAMRCASRA